MPSKIEKCTMNMPPGKEEIMISNNTDKEPIVSIFSLANNWMVIEEKFKILIEFIIENKIK